MFEKKSKIDIKVLGYFFMNPKKANYIHELSKILEVNVANLDKKLKELEKEKILVSELKGKQKYYSLNKNFPLLKEYKKVFDYKYGLEIRLKSFFAKIDGIEDAYIFGSYAKGGFEEGSDIDILLVGSHSSIEVARGISKIEKDYAREINVQNYSRKEFNEKRKKKDEFLANIFNGKFIKIL